MPRGVDGEYALARYRGASLFWETPFAYFLYVLFVLLIIVTAVYILFTIYRLKHEVSVEQQ